MSREKCRGLPDRFGMRARGLTNVFDYKDLGLALLSESGEVFGVPAGQGRAWVKETLRADE